MIFPLVLKALGKGFSPNGCPVEQREEYRVTEQWVVILVRAAVGTGRMEITQIRKKNTGTTGNNKE